MESIASAVIDLANRHFGEYKIRNGQIIPEFCPICHGGDNHDRETFAVGMFNGSASELCKMYISFCDGNNLSHGLADSQPATSFGKQLNSVKGDLWRIKKTISSERKKEGMFYSIGSF